MKQFDVVAAIEALGIEYSVRGNEANALCPGHMKTTGRADNTPSWWINLDSGVHMCFSCGYKGNLLHLVCDVLGFFSKSWIEDGYDFVAARQWLATCSELSIEELAKQLESLPAYIESAPKPLEMSEARLAVFVEPPVEALASRNITAESAKKYGVVWDKDKQAWILPLREPHFNKLLGWQEKGTIDRTFMNRPAGLPRSKTLFGVNQQLEDIVVVVESPLDCLRIESAGVSGAVAVCGSAVSDDQIKLLRYSKKIIVAFDNPNLDSAGLKASKQMLNYGRKYGLNLFFFNYGGTNKKDPGEMSNEEILWGIENSVSSIFGEQAYVQGDPKALSG